MKRTTTTIAIALLALAAAYGAKAEDRTQISELPAQTCTGHTVNNLSSLVDYLTATSVLVDTLGTEHRHQVEVSV